MAEPEGPGGTGEVARALAGQGLEDFEEDLPEVRRPFGPLVDVYRVRDFHHRRLG
jgi:hypothetical protein